MRQQKAIGSINKQQEIKNMSRWQEDKEQDGQIVTEEMANKWQYAKK